MLRMPVQRPCLRLQIHTQRSRALHGCAREANSHGCSTIAAAWRIHCSACTGCTTLCLHGWGWPCHARSTRMRLVATGSSACCETASVARGCNCLQGLMCWSRDQPRRALKTPHCAPHFSVSCSAPAHCPYRSRPAQCRQSRPRLQLRDLPCLSNAAPSRRLSLPV
jgi:hypothetical protein